MNKFIYDIGVRIPFGKILPAVAEVESSVNKSMECFGFSEKLVITSVLPLELTLGREPTPKEFQDIQDVMLTELRKTYKFAEIEYVRRKL